MELKAGARGNETPDTSAGGARGAMTDEAKRGQATICPNCESTGGDPATPCSNPLCSKKGYHFIPEASFVSHRRQAAQMGVRPDPDVGRLVAGRYLVVEKLGQGGMGAVYLALQIPLLREVALKTISDVAVDDDFRQRFEREARSISILYHPNIVGLIDYGVDPESGPFMVLELVKGGKDLATVMEERRGRGEAWSPGEIIAIFTQILTGLSVAHKGGFVHRDIKPQNIMLVSEAGAPPFVKILDFGLAKALADIPGMKTLTTQGAILGTPQYMAPEQVASKGEIDHRCDLYAVGAILFEIATGLPCCDGQSTQQIFFTKLDPDFSPLRKLAPGSLPPPLEAFLRKALTREPEQRFSSALEMKDCLVEALGGAKDSAGSHRLLPADSAPTMVAPPGSIPGTSAEAARSGGGASAVKTGSIAAPPGPEPGRRSKALWGALMAFGVAAVLLLGLYLGPRLGLFKPGSAPETKSTAASPASGSSSPTGVPATPEPPRPSLSRPQESSATPQPPPAPSDAAESPDIPPGPEKKKVAAKKIPSLPAEPPAEAVAEQIAKLKKMLKRCVDTHNMTIESKVDLAFEGFDGKVHSHGFIYGAPTKNPEGMKCMNEAFYALRVPPFTNLNHIEVFVFNASPSPAPPPDAESD
jgi:serine/threonine protein kinase